MSIESDLFNSAVPKRVQIGMLRATIDGCISAYDKAKARPKEWFHDAIPAERRLAVEPLLHHLVLPSGFSSRPVRTPSTTYTRIESGSVVITAVTRNFARNRVRPDPY